MIDAIKLVSRSGDVSAQETGESSEPISLAQAKAHLRVNLPDEDDYIAGLIVAARETAEGRLNRTLARRQRVAVVDTWADALKLAKPPLLSVDGVEYFDENGVSQVLTADEYQVLDWLDPARVALARGFAAPQLARQPGAVRVTYTAGYAVGQVPTPIIQWMLLVIGSFYENRETMSAGVQVYSIPEDFMKWLLQPYMVYE